MSSIVDQFAKDAQVDGRVPVEFRLLSHLVVGYSEKPVLVRRSIRELYSQDPLKFCAAALRVVKEGCSRPAHTHLTGLLVENNLLLAILSDPNYFPLDKARLVAREYMRVEPLLDVRLVSHVLREDSAVNELNAASLDRVLAIVDDLSDCTRLIPYLLKLTAHDDPRVQSKASMLVARGHRNPDWLQNQLSNIDPRVRANAIEGLLDTKPGEREIQTLWNATSDPNHRVLTTALLVLYTNGETRAGDQLLELVKHPSSEFRAATAWAMGRTADYRFLETLQHMIRNESGVVKRMAIQSSVYLRKKAGPLPASPAPAAPVPASESNPENGPAKSDEMVHLSSDA